MHVSKSGAGYVFILLAMLYCVTVARAFAFVHFEAVNQVKDTLRFQSRFANVCLNILSQKRTFNAFKILF